MKPVRSRAYCCGHVMERARRSACIKPPLPKSGYFAWCVNGACECQPGGAVATQHNSPYDCCSGEGSVATSLDGGLGPFICFAVSSAASVEMPATGRRRCSQARKACGVAHGPHRARVPSPPRLEQFAPRVLPTKSVNWSTRPLALAAPGFEGAR